MITDTVVKKRGRQPGVTKQKVTIKDPLLGKYYIEIDENQFSVMLADKPQPVAYCTTVGRALYQIARHKVMDGGGIYTIQGYINEFKEVLAKFDAINY